MRRALSVLAVAVALASCGDGPTAATPDSPPVPTTSSVVTSPPGPSTTAATSTTSASSTAAVEHHDHCDDSEQHDDPDEHAVRDSRRRCGGASWGGHPLHVPRHRHLQRRLRWSDRVTRERRAARGSAGQRVTTPSSTIRRRVEDGRSRSSVTTACATTSPTSTSSTSRSSRAPGSAAGDHLGTIGTTGRSSACHVHFGMSPPCPEREWSVRRGVVWPYRYLDDWRSGGQASPADEVAAFVAEQPDACASAADDPVAADA